MKSSIFEKIAQAISTYNGEVDINALNQNTKLVDDLEFDSISIVQLIIDLEEIFGIVVTDDKLVMDDINTIGKLQALVTASLEGK